MYETDEARDHLIAKSPDCVYYCLQHGHTVMNIKTLEKPRLVYNNKRMDFPLAASLSPAVFYPYS